MKKMLLVFAVLLVLISVAAIALATNDNVLENSGMKWTIYIDVSEQFVANGSYTWGAPMQLRIPQKEWQDGNGVTGGGEPEWTLTYTSGTVNYAFDYEKENWNGHQGIMLKKKGNWPGEGSATYTVTCKWNNKTYEGTAAVEFKKLGTAPSGIDLTIAPYNPDGTAMAVTGNTITLEQGKSYAVRATYKDNEPACQQGHWLNVGINQCVSQANQRPTDSQKLIIQADQAGECELQFSLTPGQTNLQVNGTYKVVITSGGNAGNTGNNGTTNPVGPADSVLENAGMYWTIYTDLPDQFVENGTFSMDGHIQIRIPGREWTAGLGDPVWSVSQTGGTVQYAFKTETMENQLSFHKGSAYPGDGTAEYKVSCTWNQKTYTGTVSVQFKKAGSTPSGLIFRIAPYDPDTNTIGTFTDVGSDGIELIQGKEYALSAAFKDNTPKNEQGFWLNGDNELIKRVSMSNGRERPDESNMLIYKAEQIGSGEKHFDLTVGMSNFQTSGSMKIKVTCAAHTPETLPAIAASCTADGLTEGEKCSVCGEILKAQQPIPATGHTEVVDAAVAATCTAAGKTEGKHCSACNTVLVSQQEIAALGHDWDDGAVTKEATYTDDGIKTFTCKRCGEKREEVISMKIPLGQTGWVSNADGTWSYGNAAGDAAVGPTTIGGTAYCFNEQGKMITGWAEVGGKWYYADASGELYRGWKEVGKIWYYFRADGEMATGWVNDGGTYYYMKADGSMATGWIEDNGKWYYMDKGGAMKTGWMKDGKNWYLLKSGGEMATGWTKDGGTWYYFTSSGAMKTGWYEEKESDGTSSWYWFDKDGAMATGWKEIDRKWEFFDNSGVWQYTWAGKK